MWPTLGVKHRALGPAPLRLVVVGGAKSQVGLHLPGRSVSTCLHDPK